MVRQLFSNSPHYTQSIQGLRRLHELAASGQEDTPAAEAVRDRLEHPWNLLSEVEKERITGLSEDLYSIIEPSEQAEPMNPQAERKLIEAYEARQSGEWDKALDLLRCWGRYLEPAELSNLRGSIWHEAGDYETAALFFRHASQLKTGPEQPFQGRDSSE
jgi:hypothetical protein